MKKTRLLKLADFLENEVPETKFNMDNFGTDWLLVNGKKATARTCGSSACALGWATTIQSFRRAGFKPLAFTDSTSFFSHVPKYGIHRAFAAAKAFFDISIHDTEYLFAESRNGHRTPKQVANNIRRFVEKHA